MSEKVSYVTRSMIRSLKRMDVGVFELPDLNHCIIARQQAYNLQPILGRRFRTKIDYKTKSITIIRIQ